ncbi:MAG: rhodanese-like domain-containing protein [Planctomycetota bacterium]
MGLLLTTGLFFLCGFAFAVRPTEANGQETPALPSAYQPGVIYREYARHNGNDQWRVTDKEAVKKFGQRAKDFLPNPVLTIDHIDLEHAISAEMILDRWGGHRGTINKRVRFNENAWITIPEIQNTPPGIRPEQLMFQDNPVVQVPLNQLVNGTNRFQADCDEKGGFGWGQWGLYSMILRVYYDPAKRGPLLGVDAKLVSPRSGDRFGDDPVIKVQADSKRGIVRVDVVASYDGFDEDGDGDFGGWHESRFQLQRGRPNEIRNHVGTRWRQPYRFEWNTHWVPDQPAGGIKLIARVLDADGYWAVTEIAENLTLDRNDVSVRLYKPKDVPEDFAVRVDETKSCWFDIPTTSSPDGPELTDAVEAAIHLRTWHGATLPHHPIRLNEYEFPAGGKDHHYDYDLIELPPSSLRPGRNEFRIHSSTEHHMLEVLWPGPALVVRYDQTDKPFPSTSLHPPQTQMTVPTDVPVEISVQEVHAMMTKQDDFLLLDVRQPDEYEIARIEGAVLIPMGELGARIDELAGKEDQSIVVHCHHGGRSLRVTEALRAKGFSRVQNMTGGIDQWSQQIDENVPRY